LDGDSSTSRISKLASQFSVKNKTRSELAKFIQEQLGCNYLLVDVNENSKVFPNIYAEVKKQLSNRKTSFLGKMTE
jgi:hypothetical protein